MCVFACAFVHDTELFSEDAILFVKTQDRDLANVCNAAFAEFSKVGRI